MSTKSVIQRSAISFTNAQQRIITGISSFHNHVSTKSTIQRSISFTNAHLLGLTVICHVVAYLLTDKNEFYASKESSIDGLSSLYDYLNTHSIIQRGAIFVLKYTPP